MIRSFIKELLVSLGLRHPAKGVKISGERKAEILLSYQAPGTTAFVETGTEFGTMIEAVGAHFANIYSIELDAHLYEQAVKKFGGQKKVHLYHGDSAIEIHKILPQLTGPTLFWLDAHGGGDITFQNSPIEGELRAIFGHAVRGHVVLIDDARHFSRQHIQSIETMARTNAYGCIIREGLFILTPHVPSHQWPRPALVKKLTGRARWKFLLAVFKIKRFVHAWFGTRQLDYAPRAITILTDSLREYETRARSVKKEPKTVLWIEQHGGPHAVLYDIGANIGAYSLIAAANGAEVIAFEPAPQNIYKLHENIVCNKLNERITVVPLMLEAHNGIAKIFTEDRSFGKTYSFSFKEQLSNPASRQAFLAMSLDACRDTFSLPVPTMMKIDVDGAEMRVLQGAEKLLGHPELRTILIEVDNCTDEVLPYMKSRGFSVVDEERAGAGAMNYVFNRL